MQSIQQKVAIGLGVLASFLTPSHSASDHPISLSDPANAITTNSASYKLDKLILIGGGEKPELAINKFIEWAGGSEAKILLIPWASSYSSEELKSYYLSEVFAKYNLKNFVVADSTEAIKNNPEQFINSLNSYTGIFFSGGDQNKTLNFLDENPEIRYILKQTCLSDIAVCTTSAGTAIMSEFTFTGLDDKLGLPILRPGFGLIPYPVDQHFIERNREPRLRFATNTFGKVGIGIDSGHAVIFSNGQINSVGKSCLSIYTCTEQQGKTNTDILADGESIIIPN
jgi:cyanophycinase